MFADGCIEIDSARAIQYIFSIQEMCRSSVLLCFHAVISESTELFLSFLCLLNGSPYSRRMLARLRNMLQRFLIFDFVNQQKQQHGSKEYAPTCIAAADV